MTDTERLQRASDLVEQIRRELWTVTPPAVPEFRRFYDEAIQLQLRLARALTSLESIYPYLATESSAEEMD